jgi:hypothetical protein
MATITFENVRDVNPYYKYDPRVLTGLNAVPNVSYAHKANTIKAILEGSDQIPNFIDDVPYWENEGELPPARDIGPNLRPVPRAPVFPAPPQEVRVRLHTTRETLTSLGRVNDFCFGTISQICMADANHVPDAEPYRTVHIEMDAWYFENYTLGYCTGMLCHEFAVHPLGDYRLKHRSDDALATEARYKRRGDRAGQAYGDAPHAQVTPSTAGQADHAFAAHPSSPRHDVYMETVIDVAVSMLRFIDNGPIAGQVAVANRDVTDLFKCYLMDVASIHHTNDHRPKGIVDPAGLARCFNTHLMLLTNTLNAEGNDPLAVRLIGLLPGQTGALTVMKDFGYLFSSVLWGLGPTWSKSTSGF